MWGKWARCAIVLISTFSIPASAQPAPEADKLYVEALRLYQTGKYSDALPVAQAALALRENILGTEHRNVGNSLFILAAIYKSLGLYDNSEPLYNRCLTLREKALGPDHADVGVTLNNIGGLYESQGRYAEAERTYKRSLAIAEKALGPDHPEVGTVLNNLAELYRLQGRYAEAEPLYERDLAITEKVLGPEHPNIGITLSNIALMYQNQGRYGEAVPLLLRSVENLEKALGPDHPDISTPLNNLAEHYRLLGQFAPAEHFQKRTLAVREKTLGPDHPWVAVTLNNMALLYETQGRHAEAERHLERSLIIRERVLGPEHPDVADALHNLAQLAVARNDISRAAKRWRAATAIVQQRAERGVWGQREGSDKGEAQQRRFFFEGLIKASYQLQLEGTADSSMQAATMFESAQWIASSEAAAALSQMASRSASGSPHLSALIRQRQDLVTEWQAADKKLSAFKGSPPQQRNALAEAILSDRISAIDRRLGEIGSTLAKDFPDYAGLVRIGPASVIEVQAALDKDEALVLFLDTDKGPIDLPEATFVWVVTKSDVRWLRTDLGKTALEREVYALRCGLDATSWHEDGAQRCQNLLMLEPENAPKTGGHLPFQPHRAFALYSKLLADAADLIKDKHLLVVPSGALTTLPFHVLVTKPSIDLKSARWLARDHAITVLPSVAALKSLRRVGRPSAASKPMIGFANPLLDGNQADPADGPYFHALANRAQAQTSCATKAARRTASLRSVPRSATQVSTTSGLADLTHLRMQTPLPETADEVCAVARSIKADVREMRIGARATEREIKRLSASGNLTQYRIVHFATHGVVAGQLTNTSEPGLILTPPKEASVEDDGYLSASEIAGLKLDADWVILSACNTAGGVDQGEAAEALSGLARVFFYGGARALLVSHWEVDSDAAVKLVAAAIGELAKDKRIGRGEALRRAILALIEDTSRPKNWVPATHPSVWAPFVVVGEGGAGR